MDMANTEGRITLSDGSSEPVFIRYRPGSQARERVALDMMQLYGVPAPRFRASIEVPGGEFFVQSLVPGVDLDQLLPPSPLRPVLPGTGAHDHTCQTSVYSLVAAMEEFGNICACMHVIQAPDFGNLVGDVYFDSNGVAFTLAKSDLLLAKSVQRGWLSLRERDIISKWLHERVSRLYDGECASFVHADLHPANIRLQERNGQWHVNGIIDFEHAKGWFAEYDLVVVRWHLVDDTLWSAFVREYGDIDEERMETFEVIKLLMILSGWPLGYPYAQWAFDKLQGIPPLLDDAS